MIVEIARAKERSLEWPETNKMAPGQSRIRDSGEGMLETMPAKFEGI